MSWQIITRSKRKESKRKGKATTTCYKFPFWCLKFSVKTCNLNGLYLSELNWKKLVSVHRDVVLSTIAYIRWLTIAVCKNICYQNVAFSFRWSRNMFTAVFPFTLKSSLARKGITKKGRFLMPPNFNVLPLKTFCSTPPVNSSWYFFGSKQVEFRFVCLWQPMGIFLTVYR